MKPRDWVLFIVRTTGFALVTATGGWLAVPVTAAVWSTLASAERRRELRLALAAAASWALLLAWSSAGAGTSKLLALLGAIFRVPGWAFVLLTLAVPALLAWSAAVVTSAISSEVSAYRARRRLAGPA
jgi:signal transduction histidine kinase